MIKEVVGDILLSKAQLIGHGVAPGDHFNNGLALQLREQWPAMAKDFRHWCHTHSPKPGGAWVWPRPDGRRIANLLTQDPAMSEQMHPGKAHLEHVNAALRDLRREIEREGIASVALPRLATGVGGLTWEDVKPLIERQLGELAIPIFLYTHYQKGVAAQE